MCTGGHYKYGYTVLILISKWNLTTIQQGIVVLFPAHHFTNRMATERVIWYLWTDSLAHHRCISNNCSQSDHCLVICLPKPHASLICEGIGDESQMFLSTEFDSIRGISIIQRKNVYTLKFITVFVLQEAFPEFFNLQRF